MSKSYCVTLRHATPVQNLESIARSGIRPEFSRGPRMEIWLHSRRLSAWAVAHTADRHHVRPADVALLEVRVPRHLLRRRARGLYSCDVPLASFVLLTSSPGRLNELAEYLGVAP